jgi:predicted nucleic acid-binding protein
MNITLKNRLFVVTGLVFFLAAACKPQSNSGELSVSAKTTPTPVASPQTQGPQVQSSQIEVKSRRLSAVEWFTKQNVTAEEERTVDAIIESLRNVDLREGTPQSLALWAERNLQVLQLDDRKLSNISPILAFRNISTLSIVGNSFSQSQVDELLRSLPRLKNLLTDRGISCRANSQVTCLQ